MIEDGGAKKTLGSATKDVLGKISFCGIGYHGDYAVSRSETLGYLKGSKDIRARTGSTKYAFFAR